VLRRGRLFGTKNAEGRRNRHVLIAETYDLIVESCSLYSPTPIYRAGRDTTHEFIVCRDASQYQTNALGRDQLHPLLLVLRVRSRKVPRPIATSRLRVAIVHDVVNMACGSQASCFQPLYCGANYPIHTNISPPSHKVIQTTPNLPCYPTPHPNVLAFPVLYMPCREVIPTISPQTTSCR
jgi:hypothetical protein